MSHKLLYLISFILLLAVGLTSEANAAMSGLIGWWKFDGDTLDSSGLGNDGTVVGNPTFVVGKVGSGAIDLDGDDYVTIDGVADDLTSNDITLSGWVKTTDTQGLWLSCNGAPGGNVNKALWSIDNGQAAMYDGANSSYEGYSNTVVNDGEWHMLTYVRSWSTGYIYVDGFQENTHTANWDFSSTDRWSIGQEWDDLNASDFLIGIVDDVQIYNRALTVKEIEKVMLGIPPPKPAHEEIDVPLDVVLSWPLGEFSAPTNGHKVYFGESFDDVNDAVGGVAQTAASYTPAQRLDFNTTYYWRVDEVNNVNLDSPLIGEVWQFTTELFAYPIENITATASSTHQADTGPENTINGSGLDVNDLHSMEPADMWLSGSEPNAWIEYEFDKIHKLYEMWVWNSNGLMESVLGFGLKDVTIEHSTNGTDYTLLGTTHEFVRAPGAPDYAHNTTVDFSGAAAEYVRLTANSNWGGFMPQYGLSELRFFSIPVQAKEPSPDSGTTDVAVGVTLGFRAGREAVTHDVYLSPDEQAVIDGNAPVSTVTETSIGPLSLDLDTTYYWKISEVNEADTTTTWHGDIWNFSTQEFIVVDDFEDYNNYPPDEIWSTWADGYGVSANGATVGYPDPDWNAGEHFVETTIVHGGDQSMPFFYSNTGGATYSEGERTFAVPQDWTKAGVQTLVLYFQGSPGNTGQLYVKVNGSKVVYPGDAGNIAKPWWNQCSIDLASLGVSLQSITTLAIGIEGSGAGGTLYIDDIGLYALAPAPPNEWRIADSADDVEEAVAAGGIDMTSSDLELAYENPGQGNPQIIGLRFTGIPIPNGATITEAWVRFQVDETKGGTEAVNLIIEGELSLDAAGFTDTVAFNVSSRPTTTAQVQWSVPNWTTEGDQGPDQTTPSIASIIQEIVNQNGWSGGTIVLMFRDNPANPSLGIRCAEAGPGPGAVLLHIRLSVKLRRNPTWQMGPKKYVAVQVASTIVLAWCRLSPP